MDQGLESELHEFALAKSLLEGYAHCRVLYDDQRRPADWTYLAVNPAFERLTGLRDVVGKCVSEVIPGIHESNPELLETYARVAGSGERETFEAYVPALDIWFSVSAYSEVENEFVAIFENVTERKRVEWERERTVEFLDVLSECRSAEELIRRALTFVHEHGGCEAVGIRLREGDDYPYYETRGFLEAFVLAENSLCRRNARGEPLLDANLDPVLDCMCGNVIRGRFDPAQPFFTEAGSFWSNGTTAMLASTSDEDRLTHTRNRCNGDGYESVALIPLRVGEEPLGLLQLNDHREGAFTPQTVTLWERLAGYLASAHARLRAEEGQRALTERLRGSLASAVAALGTTVETRDPYTAGHERRVAELACAIAERLGWDEAKVDTLRTAALIHDIGKIAVPAEILSKPGRLGETERRLVQGHPQAAYDILAPIDFGAPIATIVLQHHEHVDGSGYPAGLVGEEILLEARILAVADVVEAMLSHRPYRPALTMSEAVSEVRDGMGTRYDAEVAEACLQLLEEQGFRFTC